MEWLLVGRLVAGMGGGGLMSVSSIVASDLIPLKQRALFQVSTPVYLIRIRISLMR